jgi:hypothetical protein
MHFVGEILYCKGWLKKNPSGMMDGCDEKYNIHNTSNPSNCDGQIAPKKKRDEKPRNIT